MNTEDRLDAALSSDIAAFAATSEVRALVATGDEIGDALSQWSLDAATRTRIYAEALAMATVPSLIASGFVPSGSTVVCWRSRAGRQSRVQPQP